MFPKSLKAVKSLLALDALAHFQSFGPHSRVAEARTSWAAVAEGMVSLKAG